MINWKITILAAVIHSLILIAFFGFIFSEGLKIPHSTGYPLAQWITGLLALPVLMPVFFLTQDVSFVTLAALATNSMVWGVATSFLIFCMRRLVQRLRNQTVDNT